MLVRFYDWVFLHLYDCLMHVRFYDWMLVRLCDACALL